MGFCDTEIRFDTIDGLKNDLSQYRDQTLVLILSPSGEKRWGLTAAVNELAAANTVARIHAPANPTQADILNAVHLLNGVRPNEIVAIGGGSAIDLAKGISASFDFISQQAPSIEQFDRWMDSKPQLPDQVIAVTAVPTTAGTGSEVTQWATVWDAIGSQKRSLDDVKLRPKKAWIIPELTYSLPRAVRCTVTFDALSHAMEAFWSKARTPLVQELSIAAVRLIYTYMQDALNEDPQACDYLCRASLLAGLAFSQTRTTACHAISYPLTSVYDIPHGMAVAMTLPQLLEINRTAVPECARLEEIFASDGGLRPWMEKMHGSRICLSAYGLSREDAQKLTALCFNKSRMANNPVALSEDEVRRLLTDLTD